MSLKYVIKRDLLNFKFDEKIEIDDIDLSKYDLLERDYILYILKMRKARFDDLGYDHYNMNEAIDSVLYCNDEKIRWIPFQFENIVFVYLLNDVGLKIINKFYFKIK